MKQRWIWIALLNFLIAAFMGTVLRFAFVEEIPGLDFKNFLHGHSHVAMLGWVYMALYALLIHAFVPADKKALWFYNWLFWITQISVVGMLISFPIQGYGPVSIAFSTMHIICSYVFVGWLWTDLPAPKSFSKKLIKTALIFMVLSTIGVWLMGPIMATQLRGSAFYYMAVQFYLHFQFNGWFIFAVLALFFRHLESSGIAFSGKDANRFYWLLVVSCVLTYALAVAWAEPYAFIFVINSVGVIVQLLALIFFIRLLWSKRSAILASFGTIEKALLQLAFFAFAGKILVQAAVAIPYMATIGFTIRNFVIGFIHLILLGTVTCFLIAYALRQRYLMANLTISKAGIWLLIAGFVLSEFLLFLQGAMFWGAQGFLPYYYELLFGISALMPLGILLFGIGQIMAPRAVVENKHFHYSNTRSRQFFQ